MPDYGVINIAEIEALRQACGEANGEFHEGDVCTPASGTVGCQKTLSYSGLSVETTTWFDGITSEDMLDESTISQCESIKMY